MPMDLFRGSEALNELIVGLKIYLTRLCVTFLRYSVTSRSIHEIFSTI